MSIFYNEIIKFEKWVGTKVNLIEILLKIENLDKEHLVLSRKTPPHQHLPVNGRRLQQFIDFELIPKPDGIKYNYNHIIFYFFTILMRKRGYNLKQLKGLCKLYTCDEVVEKLSQINFDKEIDSFSIESDKEYLFSDNMSQSLKELGRSEGRVLITNLTRFAITPWCHATINEQKLKGLNKQDINILTQAFRQSLIKKLGLTS